MHCFSSRALEDLACGSGRYTRWFKTSKKAAKVVGVDMSEPKSKEKQTTLSEHQEDPYVKF